MRFVSFCIACITIRPAVLSHRPLLMEEVSKSARGHQQKEVGERRLGEFDSVKKVSILIDS